MVDIDVPDSKRIIEMAKKLCWSKQKSEKDLEYVSCEPITDSNRNKHLELKDFKLWLKILT